MPYLLGLDIVTSGAKALLRDESGRVLATETVEYQLFTSGRCGASRTRPIGGAARGDRWVLRAAGVDGAQVAGLGLTGQMRGAVFLDAFDTYRKERMQYIERTLNDGQPARQSIERFFRQGVAHGADSTDSYGCMTANEAVELGPHDVDVQQLVAADFQAVEDAFAQALARGQADGSIANRNDPRKLARFLTVGFQGLQVMARARSERARLDDTVTVMMAALA